MDSPHFDLIVIGGGPAGISGALTAAAFGKRVALVEQTGMLGGAGINTGTVPSKTLRESALLLNGWRTRKLLGLQVTQRAGAQLSDFTYHERHVISAVREQTDAWFRDFHVQRLAGKAKLFDAHTVCVTTVDGPQVELHGDVILVATGSSPVRPPEFPFEHPRVHDSDEILEIQEMPQVLAVVGAGVIGAEYACTFAALGVEVHLIDGRDALLSFLDRDVAAALTTAMANSGIRFHWKERVVSCDVSAAHAVRLKLSSGAELVATDVLVAAGRKSNTDDLCLTAAGLAPGDRGLIRVDAHCRTDVGSIYAAGDVIGAPALASASMEQARVAMCHAFGLTKKELSPLLPNGVYTIPEVGMLGETEESAKSKGLDVVVGRADYAQNPRGRIIGDEAGFLKLIFRRADMRLLGVHVLGEQAIELVNVGLIAILRDGDAELLSSACFNYPTLAYLYKSATYDAVQRTLCPTKV